MFSYLFGKWFGGTSNDSPPPSDPRQSRSLSNDSFSSVSKNSFDQPSSISIDLNVPDEFESKYDTPPMSLKRLLTDYRQSSQKSVCSASLSCDSSLHPTIIEDKMHLGDISALPYYTPLNFLPSSPPMFPEVDEDFFPNEQQWNRSSSLPHVQKYGTALHNFEEEDNFMNCMLPTQPIPNFHDSQTPSESGFIDNMLPLTL